MEENNVVIDELQKLEPTTEVPEQTNENILGMLNAAAVGLTQGFKRFMAVGNGRIGKHQKSKKGATHKVGEHFVPTLPLMSPATYRHLHIAHTERAKLIKEAE